MVVEVVVVAVVVVVVVVCQHNLVGWGRARPRSEVAQHPL